MTTTTSSQADGAVGTESGPVTSPPRKKRPKPQRILLHVFLTVLGLLWMVPLILSLYSSFRPFAETEARGLLSLPCGMVGDSDPVCAGESAQARSSLSFDNYRAALDRGQFLDKYWNTALILIPSLILTLFLASLIAFAASRFTWRFNIFFLVLFTAGNLLPQQIIVAPLFQTFRRIPLEPISTGTLIVTVLLLGGIAAGAYLGRGRLVQILAAAFGLNVLLGIITGIFGDAVSVLSVPLDLILPDNDVTLSNSDKLVNSNWGIILLHVGFQMGFCTFVLSNYMKLLPKELNEAAIVDGADLWTLYSKIIMPLTRPALAALATLEFAWIYNDFFWAVVFENRGDDRPITSALNNLQGEFLTDTSQVSAAAIFVIIPVLVVYLALQRHFIAGLTLGSTKG
jgi:ABC-type glycerol-3-phosphate transport system permease component